MRLPLLLIAVLVAGIAGGWALATSQTADLVVMRDSLSRGCLVLDTAAGTHPKNAAFPMREGKCHLADWRWSHPFGGRGWPHDQSRLRQGLDMWTRRRSGPLQAMT